MRNQVLLGALLAALGQAAQAQGTEARLSTGAGGAFVLRAGEVKPGESAAPRNADEERGYREWREQKRQQDDSKK